MTVRLPTTTRRCASIRCTHLPTTIVLSESKDADILDTLAAAYAEAGVYSEAVRWQEKALEFPEFAKTQGDAARKRIELYRKGQPYHQPAKP